MRLRSNKIVQYTDFRRHGEKTALIRAQRKEREHFRELRQQNRREITQITFHRKKLVRMTDHVNKTSPMNMEGNLSENWRRFKRDFNIYLAAAELEGKAAKIRIGLLLNAAGPEVIELTETFNLTEADKADYDKILGALDAYFLQKTNVVYERFRFYQRKQKEGEPFESFLLDLKNLLKHCAFQVPDEMMRDQIVMGVFDSKLREKLLSTHNLTNTLAVEKCRLNESTKSQASNMSESTNGTANVNEVRTTLNSQKKPKQKMNETNTNNNTSTHQQRPRAQQTTQHKRTQQQQPRQQRNTSGQNYNQNANQNNNNTNRTDITDCRRCGRSHKIRECPAYGKTCRACQKLNHFAVTCRTKSINLIDYENEVSNNNAEFFIGTVATTNESVDTIVYPWTEKINVNKRDIAFKVDTGAAIDVLPLDLVKKLWPQIELKEANITLRAFGGQQLKPKGLCNLLCCYKNRSFYNQFAVVDFNIVPIIGLKSCIRFGIVQPSRNLSNKNKKF